MNTSKPFLDPLNCRIGIVGSGFVANGFGRLLQRIAPQWPLTAVLTRRNPAEIPPCFQTVAVPSERLDDFLARCDLVVECSGDIRHATEVIETALQAGKSVVTMHCEWHVTVGSALVSQGLLTEAEGDQPGSLAALREEVLSMGFEPWVYGNIKQFLNHTPTPEDMLYWSSRQGIRLRQTTAFTDGTKLQFEQALVANGLGAEILETGLAGPAASDLNIGGRLLAERASEFGQAISDYLMAPSLPPGVFITATHQAEDQPALQYLKLGPGPWYTLYRPYHLCQYEMLKTVRRVIQGGGPLLNNGPHPAISVRAVAKKLLLPGDLIENALGSFELRGEAVRWRDDPEHLPLGLIQDAVIQQRIEPGQVLTWADVELPDSRALALVRKRI